MPKLSKVKDELAKLVKRFESKHKGEWDEASTRKSLIDGFWDALGWDTDDPREVEVEKRTEIDEHLKRADYAFLERGRAKFLVEAKQPSKNLTRDKDAIFQVKRYVFNTPGSNLGILQDFEEFIPYLIIKKPSYDLPLDGIQKKLIFGYEEYADRADELLEFFSREAVLGGSIDNLLPKGKKLERVSEIVNKEFFADLMNWRLEIAKSIAKNNPKTTDHDINSAVNHLLNRLLFLRVIEDRKIENYDPLDSAVNRWKKEELGPLMAYLVEVFKRLDPKYNGAIFAEHHVDSMIIDNKPLYDCIRNLYYPQSPYQFSEMPIEVIGNAYEQYLGSVLRTTPKRQVKLEEKPEVRKAGGVYYTPKYIVDYIVEQTVGKMVEGKTPAQVSKLRILDPACGSGSFLIGAFERLQKYYIDYYTANPKKNKGYLRKDYEGKPKLDILVKKKILEENIYGVDIDPQAVDITEFSLYVKMLEGEENLPMFAETYLPELKENIKCGNSLIGNDIRDMDILPEDMDEKLAELERINPFDWEENFPEVFAKGGFDAVIGNPPYVRAVRLDHDKKYYKRHFQAAYGAYDIYVLFWEKSIELLNAKGLGGLITPNKYFVSDYAIPLRKMLIEKRRIIEIADLGRCKSIFQGALITTTVTIFSKSEGKKKIQIKILDDKTVTDIMTVEKESKNVDNLLSEEGKLQVYSTELTTTLIDKLYEESEKLDDIAEVRTGVMGFNYWSLDKHVKDSEEGVRITTNSYLDRYSFLWGKKVRLYKRSVYNPRIKKGCKAINESTWEFFNKKKVVVRGVAKRVTGNIDDEGIALLVAVHGIIPFRYEKEYILGLINSKLFNWLHIIQYYSARIPQGSLRYPVSFFKNLPIRTIDFDDADDVAKHDRMVSLVDDMLELNKRLRETESPSTRKNLEKQIAHTDRKIDELVYDLYDLTDEEIAIVEGSAK